MNSRHQVHNEKYDYALLYLSGNDDKNTSVLDGSSILAF